MAISPQWIEPVNVVTGQDHLGLQAVSLFHYGKLLPGITNLTQRARYFSIYPWFLTNYVKEIGIKNDRKKWRDFLRRCEFLYALLSLVDPDEKSVVGANMAKIILAEEPTKIDFKKHTDINKKNKQMYFKNSYGGYGLYYLGALQNLDIVYFDEKDEIEYLGNNGKSIISAMDQSIPNDIRNPFFKCVSDGVVTLDQLKRMSTILKPSNIEVNGPEAKALRRILFERKNSIEDLFRKNSLVILLQLVSQCSKDIDLSYWDIRYILLYERFPDKKLFKFKTDNEEYIHSWISFFIAEHIHFTMEVFFWSVLENLKQSRGNSIDEFIDDFVKQYLGMKYGSKYWNSNDVNDLTFNAFMHNINDRMKYDVSNWYNFKHSLYNLVGWMNKGIRDSDNKKAMYYAILAFAKLFMDYKDSTVFESIYVNKLFIKEKFPVTSYRILNDPYLNSDIGAAEGLQYLIKRYIINRHLNVALAKFRIQRQSTFKFMLQDGTIIHLEDIKPTFTTPRLRSAMNILEDLGMVVWNPPKITPIGKKYLENHEN